MGAKSRPGIQPIGDILSELIARRGLARLREQEQLENAWREVAGEPIASHSRVGSVRRGVLEVYVANSVLLQELTSFRKQELLEKLQLSLESETIQDLRFRMDSGV